MSKHLGTGDIDYLEDTLFSFLQKMFGDDIEYGQGVYRPLIFRTIDNFQVFLQVTVSAIIMGTYVLISYDAKLPQHKMITPKDMVGEYRELVLGYWYDRMNTFNKMVEDKTAVLHVDSKDQLIKIWCKKHIKEQMNGEI